MHGRDPYFAEPNADAKEDIADDDDNKPIASAEDSHHETRSYDEEATAHETPERTDIHPDDNSNAVQNEQYLDEETHSHTIKNTTCF